MMIRMREVRGKPGGIQMLGWRCKRWMDGVEDPHVAKTKPERSIGTAHLRDHSTALTLSI
jgi:hypothetical protein